MLLMTQKKAQHKRDGDKTTRTQMASTRTAAIPLFMDIS